MNDALFLQRISAELSGVLCGGRIDKINMPENEEIILTIRANRQNHKLLINASAGDARIHLTTESKENPIAAPSFLMHLRKHIGGGVISSIATLPYERVVVIEITATDELFQKRQLRLIAEIMGKYSNLILVLEDKITDCIKHVSLDLSGKRQVLPGLRYLPPPAQEGKIPPDSPAVREELAAFDGGRLDGFLLKRIFGLAPASIREAVFRAVGSHSSPLSKPQIDAIASELKQLYTQQALPTVIYSNNTPIDFLPFPYLSSGADFKHFDTLSEAVDECTRERARLNRFNQRARGLSTLLKTKINRAEKRLASLLESVTASQDFESDKNMGDLVLSNLHKIKRGDTYLICQNFFEEGAPEIKIKLDERLSPQQNAGQFFKRYNKKKRAIAYANSETEGLSRELEYLYTVRESFRLCDTALELAEIREELSPSRGRKAKPQPSKPNRIAVDGFEIAWGKNNAQNERLTLSEATPLDTFFHAKNAAGAHVIVFNKGKPIPDSVLLTAATIAATNSKMHTSPKVEVDYCPVKNVKKLRSAPLGMVTYSNHKTIIATPSL